MKTEKRDESNGHVANVAGDKKCDKNYEMIKW